ncbi:unnamed protein product [Ranitomeya imitator]|uniref:Immunoglobulin C1-set domain-containing protein n=1 Tax=Ranitomeya imitator TaxID=111125 RepID=A0ABN9MNH8_9NEOB|nr:unnamed protein product [Ranitomeya imitator]
MQPAGNKPTTPPEEVFELKAKGDVSSIACLAKDFYPKDIEIYVNKTKQENVQTILSKEGLYSAVIVQNVKYEDFTCEIKQTQNLTMVKSKDVLTGDECNSSL